MYAGVKSVKPLSDHRLLLVFDDGTRRVFDVTPWLTKGAFRELRDDDVFRTVRVSFDTVEWANGCDLCPEVLYADSQPVESVAPRRARAPAGRVMAVAETQVRYGTTKRHRGRAATNKAAS